MERYSGLGELLRVYRKLAGLTQTGLAVKAAVDARTVREWERNEGPADKRSLRRLAERTLLPEAVLTHLRAGIPVWCDAASLRYRRPEDAGQIKRRGIATRRDAERIRRFDQTIYPAASALPLRLYWDAGRLAPEVNCIYADGLTGVAGHLCCLPLEAGAYAGLREGKLHEGDLRRRDLRPLAECAAVYLCSMYAAHSECGWALRQDLYRFLSGAWGGRLFGAYAVTAKGLQACLRLGLKPVREDRDDWRRTRTEIVPVFLERRIAS